MRRTLGAGLAIGLLVVGCEQVPVRDTAAYRESLVAAAESFHEAAVAKDHDAVVALFDPDARMVPPGTPMVEGLAGVADYRFGFLETPGVELSFELVDAVVGAAGDIGWTVANVSITIRDETGIVGRDHVRDVHAWRRQPDGSWRIAIDVWNSEPPD